MRSPIARWLSTFCLIIGSSIGSVQAAGVVVEPFRLIVREVSFGDTEVDLTVVERAKLESLAHSIFRTYATPVHECDFDVFLYEGFRGSESGASLQRLDLLFERRVASLRRLLAQWGIPERVGIAIKPSEGRPLPGSNPNAVTIEIRHWIHTEGAKIEQSHLDCKWPRR